MSSHDMTILTSINAKGGCGKSYGNSVEGEVQAIHSMSGRCDSYTWNDYFEYSMDMRLLDTADKDYGGDTVGDYETVANYFNYHGITWWDGRHSPGYTEQARFAGQVAPGLTAYYEGARSSVDPSDTMPSEGPSASVETMASDGLGACGIDTSRVPASGQDRAAATSSGCAELELLLSYAGK